MEAHIILCLDGDPVRARETGILVVGETAPSRGTPQYARTSPRSGHNPLDPRPERRDPAVPAWRADIPECRMYRHLPCLAGGAYDRQ